MHHYPPIISTSKLSNYLSKIKQLSFNGKWHQILSLFNEFHKSRSLQLTQPSLFHPILKACSSISFNHGKSLHAHVIKLGVNSSTSIGNSIMDFYSKANQMGSTFMAFDSIRIKDSVSWNILICGYLDYGEMDKGICLFLKARREIGFEFEPNVSTLVLVIRTIRNLGDLIEGLKIHSYLIKTRFLDILSVRNSLLLMYIDLDMDMEFARKVFDEMSKRDVITWSVMVSGYVKNNESGVGLWVFREMLSCLETEEIDGQMMVSALKACANLNELITGRTLHGFIFRKGFDYDLFIGNSLIDMYSKCVDPDSALQIWREIPLKNIISWNSLLSGLVSNQKHSDALNLFDSMQKIGMTPDAVTLVNILQVCKHFTDPFFCKSIHTVIIRHNYELNELVINTLIDVYAKCNLINFAQKLFNWIKIRDTVSWSTMISAFTHCGLPVEAIGIYQKMIDSREKPNSVTILNLIEACTYDSELKRPKSAHGIAIRRGFASDATVGTAILDMYSKYGDIITAKKAFRQIMNKNVISFSAMIAAYGMNGFARDALSLLDEMKTNDLKPNSVTILSVLSACSHGGLMDEGLSFFQNLIEAQDFNPNLEHYSCLIDLLSRCGKLDLATELIKKLAERQKAGASAWGAFLSGLRMSENGNKEIDKKAVSRVLELEPNNSSGYVLASSMYASRGLWADSARIRALIKDKDIKIVAGYSMVNVNNKCYRFVAGDKNQFLSNEIQTTVEDLHECMKTERSWIEVPTYIQV